MAQAHLFTAGGGCIGASAAGIWYVASTKKAGPKINLNKKTEKFINTIDFSKTDPHQRQKPEFSPYECACAIAAGGLIGGYLGFTCEKIASDEQDDQDERWGLCQRNVNTLNASELREYLKKNKDLNEKLERRKKELEREKEGLVEGKKEFVREKEELTKKKSEHLREKETLAKRQKELKEREEELRQKSLRGIKYAKETIEEIKRLLKEKSNANPDKEAGEKFDKRLQIIKENWGKFFSKE